MATPDGAGALNYAIRVPRGVIAVVCPWNLPLLLMTWKVAPALACGNTVVVKPSEETPTTATLLGEVMNEAGIPQGVYNVVHGFGPGSTGEFLTRHPGVDGITFTGETATGTAIMKAAADSAARLVRAWRQERRRRVRRLRSRQGHRRHDALGIRQLRPGVPRHRTRLRRAPHLRAFVARLKAAAEALKLGDPFDKALGWAR